MDTDFEIFKGKSYSSLCEDIYNNSNQTKQQIEILVSELRQLIKSVNDAMMIVPLIKEYLDVGVKNDEHLVKLAAVLQRYTTNAMKGSGEGGGSMILSEQEKKQLLDDVQSTLLGVKKEEIDVEKQLDDVKKKVEEKKKEISIDIEKV